MTEIEQALGFLEGTLEGADRHSLQSLAKAYREAEARLKEAEDNLSHQLGDIYARDEKIDELEARTKEIESQDEVHWKTRRTLLSRIAALEGALKASDNYITLAVQDESGRKDEVVKFIRKALSGGSHE